MSSLESWAIDKLSVFLGFDPETLQTQIIPYLMSSNSPDAFADQLMDMVGTSDDALNFIQEFTARRFQKETKKQPLTPVTNKMPPVSIVEESSAPILDTTVENAFPSLPSQSYETVWPANINVHQKKEDEYFAGLRKSKRSKNRSQQSSATKELRATAFPSEQKKETSKKKESNKKNKEMTLEAALKELDIKSSEIGKKRKTCNCQATKHPLLIVAPNCLSCGKIICTAEGVGPCTFCGSPVLSKEQQIALIAQAKRKRAEEKRAKNQPKRVLSTPQKSGMAAYASKLGGSMLSPYQSSDEDDIMMQNRLKAEQHKDKLLEFQRTSAQRSTVIDQATDFELPTDQSNPWLTPQERALALKKQQANLKRLEQRGNANRHKVMTIDIQTKQVKVEDATQPSSSSEDEDNEENPVDIKNKRPSNPEDTTSAGTYAYNPLLKGITAPKFISKQKDKHKSKGRLRRKERVQYELDDVMNDYMYSTSVADDDTVDLLHEPVACP
ncbi:putative zinc finger motif, C2HC5-type-domain-containing protein [Cokeromyces recurvatus]|uniref:putative zinc finger motif, C2HC5-type-domain-containing protein n=1 Tax=Cokeromyces recurvatus TaxID=90255 RepID=UPI00221E9285|nr:putative zinc finger motif, C2HC5-type-domain-containing protein [Cokeromyces recurvatus]KAI7904135.1 putative zinc finger motif, C2HC5-type-domain-containing protein [Cokeromyces recurvatus]